MSKSKRTKNTTSPGFQPKSLGILIVAAILLIAGGGYLIFSGSESANAREITLAPLSQMPDYVRNAPPNVQEAYQFAAANPEMLDQMPCYCGCGGVGHDDNIDCYVKAFNADGSVAEFDNHAAL